MKKIKIKFTFVNNKNQRKTVEFYIDEQYYKDLHHPSISEEVRNECLLAEYRMWCGDDKYSRKHVRFAVDDNGKDIEGADDNQLSPNEQYLKTKTYNEQHQMLMDYISQIKSEKQRQAFIYIYIDGLKSSEACKLMNISRSSFSELLSNAVKSFENITKIKLF